MRLVAMEAKKLGFRHCIRQLQENETGLTSIPWIGGAARVNDGDAIDLFDACDVGMAIGDDVRAHVFGPRSQFL